MIKLNNLEILAKLRKVEVYGRDNFETAFYTETINKFATFKDGMILNEASGILRKYYDKISKNINFEELEIPLDKFNFSEKERENIKKVTLCDDLSFDYVLYRCDAVDGPTYSDLFCYGKYGDYAWFNDVEFLKAYKEKRQKIEKNNNM